ncbi:hypothetical protein GKE82_06330 [Conexibacter sp. W3-3-2]|uniref:hypothetical protein n=1 Tax=Conexibacter sp. W3-3-2 TaxID=2675227 RepID=UPI0012B7DE7F|nr:hypothetical protein [Conexibacter sp. W3-3-2]MTD43930.1 hypothetical protein [Conexibacter sp. W3-3-2]
MTSRSLLAVGAAAAAGLGMAGPASAAVIATDRPCYVENQPMLIGGQQFAPNSNYTVKTDQLFAFGNADAAGNWLSNTETAPIVVKRTTVPQPFTLTATQDGVEVATAQFNVVNLLVTLASTRGRPTGRTTWRVSGFTPGQSVYVHVRRGGKTLRNVRLGRADAPCGRLTTKQRRLPGISSRTLRRGTYDLYVDNKRTFSRSTRPQYRSSVTVFTVFR